MVSKHIACFKKENELFKHLELINGSENEKFNITIKLDNEIKLSTIVKLLDINHYSSVSICLKTVVVECEDNSTKEPNCGVEDKNGSMLSLAYYDENYL